MKLLNEALRKIETLWSKEPKHAVHRGEKTFFQFRCILNNGISPDRFGDIDLQLPTEFKEFLLVSNGLIYSRMRNMGNGEREYLVLMSYSHLINIIES